MPQERTYRNQLYHDRLISFRSLVKETDLFIQADMNLYAQAKESILLHRGTIESFIGSILIFRPPWCRCKFQNRFQKSSPT